MTITISISETTWKMLNARKEPGESFDSVITKALLEIPEDSQSKLNKEVK